MTTSKMRLENAKRLCLMLEKRGSLADYVSDCDTLQAASRAMHRLDERACCEDLTCEHCEGAGSVENKANGARNGMREDCHYCAGRGLTTGKREARIVAKVAKIAESYGLRAYWQGDPRGWPLHLIPSESGPASEDDSWYSSRGFAVCPH